MSSSNGGIGGSSGAGTTGPQDGPGEHGDARIRVLCVDDNAAISRLLELSIGLEPDMESVGSLRSAAGLLEEIGQRQPDVVLLDLSMPEFDPMTAIREITARYPACRLIVLSGYEEREMVEGARAAGADGYVRKAGPEGTGALFDAIRAVRRGRHVFPD